MAQVLEGLRLVDLLDGGLIGVGHVGHTAGRLAPGGLVEPGDNGIADRLHLLLLVLELLRLEES